jgi:hypothetical protein
MLRCCSERVIRNGKVETQWQSVMVINNNQLHSTAIRVFLSTSFAMSHIIIRPSDLHSTTNCHYRDHHHD